MAYNIQKQYVMAYSLFISDYNKEAFSLLEDVKEDYVFHIHYNYEMFIYLK